MPARRSAAIAVLALAFAAILGSVSLASAHQGVPGGLDGSAHSITRATAGEADRPAGAIGTAVLLLLSGALAVVASARPRSRRAVAIAIALLLCVFAFEDAVHSVHHGIERNARIACTFGAASAHLTAAAPDGSAAVDPILAIVADAVQPEPAGSHAHVPCPEQGRAPPSTL